MCRPGQTDYRSKQPYSLPVSRPPRCGYFPSNPRHRLRPVQTSCGWRPGGRTAPPTPSQVANAPDSPPVAVAMSVNRHSHLWLSVLNDSSITDSAIATDSGGGGGSGSVPVSPPQASRTTRQNRRGCLIGIERVAVGKYLDRSDSEPRSTAIPPRWYQPCPRLDPS